MGILLKVPKIYEIFYYKKAIYPEINFLSTVRGVKR